MSLAFIAGGGPPRHMLPDGDWLYFAGMTSRMGAKGQVVIPKVLRDRANLHPGDEVDFELREDEIVVVARRQQPSLGGLFSHSGMASRLLEDRAHEPR